jgi:hypothetical protein
VTDSHRRKLVDAMTGLRAARLAAITNDSARLYVEGDSSGGKSRLIAKASDESQESPRISEVAD